ncbi:hypothetical protein NYS50_11820 [Curtobacterium flaccumfaciens pv. flaccumfaciens]|uniref:hypothetical protein n=1 Tax=Curtobacterium flaccumfaciens TaxID=2035 RepID=UPI00217E0CD9|nr:hypothetical protein [Curtobacterium flaccumfaciens]MCS6548564.1 hypothetical protein [Curtobacterium flaccumfaciens pv. flaccumfaciens]
MSSFLEPIDAVGVGDATIVPDATRPVAAVVTGDDVRWVTWPDAPLPDGAVDEVQVLATDEGAWVVYVSREDAEGDLDTESRTAVHVTPAGVTCAVDLGDRRVLGADVEGLWIGDPRDASMWMGEDEDEDPEDEGLGDPDDDEGHSDDPLDGVDPETLPWAPSEPFWPSPEEWAATLAAGEEPEDDDPELLDDGDADDDGPATSGVPDPTPTTTRTTSLVGREHRPFPRHPCRPRRPNSCSCGPTAAGRRSPSTTWSRTSAAPARSSPSGTHRPVRGWNPTRPCSGTSSTSPARSTST